MHVLDQYLAFRSDATLESGHFQSYVIAKIFFVEPTPAEKMSVGKVKMVKVKIVKTDLIF